MCTIFDIQSSFSDLISHFKSISNEAFFFFFSEDFCFVSIVGMFDGAPIYFIRISTMMGICIKHLDKRNQPVTFHFIIINISEASEIFSTKHVILKSCLVGENWHVARGGKSLKIHIAAKQCNAIFIRCHYLLINNHARWKRRLLFAYVKKGNNSAARHKLAFVNS